MGTVRNFIFLGSKFTALVTTAMKRPLLLGRKAMTNLDVILKSRDIILPTKVHLVKAIVFPVGMYGYESWTITKAECWRIDAFELWCWRRLESPLDLKDIKPVSIKGNQSWIFIGRTNAKAEAPILWLPDVENWLLGKDPDVGKDWRQKEKGMAEDEMVGWQSNWYSMDMSLNKLWELVMDKGSLVCRSPWVHKESDGTQRLNWTELRELRQEHCCRKAGRGRGGQGHGLNCVSQKFMKA